MPPLTPLQQGSIRSHYHSTGQIIDPATGEPFEGGEHPDLAAHETLGLAPASDIPAGKSGTVAANAAVTLSSGNTNVELGLLSLAESPATEYAVSASVYVWSAGSSYVILRARSDGGDWTELDRRDCRTVTGQRFFMGTYVHTGGLLEVQLWGQYESSNATLGESSDARWGRRIMAFAVT